MPYSVVHVDKCLDYGNFASQWVAPALLMKTEGRSFLSALKHIIIYLFIRICAK